MRRRRRTSRVGLFFATLTCGAMVGGSVWLDQRGDRVRAPVQAKHERVTLRNDPQGTWYRWYELGVGVGKGGTLPWLANVEVPESRYDAIRLGDSVEVRYLPQLPLFARAADRSTATVVREALGRVGIVPLVMWVVCGMAAMWIAARVASPLVIAVGLIWMAAGFPILLRAPTPTLPSAAEGTARVNSVTLVAKSPARSTSRRRGRLRQSRSMRYLAIPYQVVQLHVPLPGSADSVLAVDAVDSGSVPGLAMGAEVAIRYEPDAPREARLALGTRQFVQRNRYHFLPGVILVPSLGILVALGFRWRRKRAGQASDPLGSATP